MSFRGILYSLMTMFILSLLFPIRMVAQEEYLSGEVQAATEKEPRYATAADAQRAGTFKLLDEADLMRAEWQKLTLEERQSDAGRQEHQRLEKLYESIVERTPDSQLASFALLNIMGMHTSVRDLIQTKKVYQRIIATFPGTEYEANAHMHMGLTYLQGVHKPDKALYYFEKIYNPRGQTNSALVHPEEGLRVKNPRELSMSSHKYVQARLQVARCFLALGQYDGARTEVENLKAGYPEATEWIDKDMQAYYNENLSKPLNPNEQWIDSDEEFVFIVSEAVEKESTDKEVEENIDILKLPWNTEEKDKLEEASAKLSSMGTRVVAPLKKAFYSKGQTFAFRNRAIAVLSNIDEAKDVLLEIAMDNASDIEVSLRRSAAEAGAALVSNRMDLEVLLASQDEVIRIFALEALVSFPIDASTFRHLERGFESNNHFARNACASVLAKAPGANFEKRIEMLLDAIPNAGSVANASKTYYGTYMTYEECLLLQYLNSFKKMNCENTQLSNTNLPMNHNAQTILLIARAERGDESVRQEIKNIAVVDPSGAIRSWAVRSLFQIGTLEDIPLLQQIEETDTFEHLDHGALTYPVQSVAHSVILQIKSKNEMN